MKHFLCKSPWSWYFITAMEIQPEAGTRKGAIAVTSQTMRCLSEECRRLWDFELGKHGLTGSSQQEPGRQQCGEQWDYKGQAQVVSEENSVGNWAIDHFLIFWQRMWLHFALILRIWLRLIERFGANFTGQGCLKTDSYLFCCVVIRNDSHEALQ